MIVRAIWEFDVDDSEMDEKFVDKKGLCEELTQREVDYLLKHNELYAEDFQYECHPELPSDWDNEKESEEDNMDIYNDIENILRNMTAGRNYRTWSEDTIKKIYPFIKQIIEDDLLNQKENGEIIGQLIVDEDMIITAMMMALDNNE